MSELDKCNFLLFQRKIFNIGSTYIKENITEKNEEYIQKYYDLILWKIKNFDKLKEILSDTDEYYFGSNTEKYFQLILEFIIYINIKKLLGINKVFTINHFICDIDDDKLTNMKINQMYIFKTNEKGGPKEDRIIINIHIKTQNKKISLYNDKIIIEDNKEKKEILYTNINTTENLEIVKEINTYLLKNADNINILEC
jgi:hypothetical protein